MFSLPRALGGSNKLNPQVWTLIFLQCRLRSPKVDPSFGSSQGSTFEMHRGTSQHRRPRQQPSDPALTGFLGESPTEQAAVNEVLLASAVGPDFFGPKPLSPIGTNCRCTCEARAVMGTANKPPGCQEIVRGRSSLLTLVEYGVYSICVYCIHIYIYT